MDFLTNAVRPNHDSNKPDRGDTTQQTIPVDHEQPPKEHSLLEELGNPFSGDKQSSEIPSVTDTSKSVPNSATNTEASSHYGGLLKSISHALEGGSQGNTESVISKSQGDDLKHQAEGGLLDRIHDTFSTRPAPPPPPPKSPTLEDRISNMLQSSDISHEHKQEEQRPAALHPQKESFIHQITDAIGGGQHGGIHASVESKSQPPVEQGLRDKLFSAISGHDGSLPPPPPKEESFMDKLGGVFKSDYHAPPPQEHEGLAERFDRLMGKENEPVKPQTLSDKINNVLGGGRSGEKNEDVLDKVIDVFQEHVLKEGQQHDESAIEQFKDKQIADTIRSTYKSATGHEFFIKENK